MHTCFFVDTEVTEVSLFPTNALACPLGTWDESADLMWRTQKHNLEP